MGLCGDLVGQGASAPAECLHDGPAVGGEADEFGASVIGIGIERAVPFPDCRLVKRLPLRSCRIVERSGTKSVFDNRVHHPTLRIEDNRVGRVAVETGWRCRRHVLPLPLRLAYVAGMSPAPPPEFEHVGCSSLNEITGTAQQSLQRLLRFLVQDRVPRRIEKRLDIGPVGIAGQVGDVAGARHRMAVGSAKNGQVPAPFDPATAMHQHIAEIECPFEPAGRTGGGDGGFKSTGKLRLLGFSDSAVTGDLSESTARSYKIRSQDILR